MPERLATRYISAYINITFVCVSYCKFMDTTTRDNSKQYGAAGQQIATATGYPQAAL